MIVKYLHKKSQTRVCRRQENEVEVMSGLSRTPKQIGALMAQKIDCSYKVSAENFDLGTSSHSSPSLESQRGIDVNQVWNEQQNARAKIKQYKQKQKKNE